MSDAPVPTAGGPLAARTEVLLAGLLSALALGLAILFPVALPLAVPLVAIPAVRVAHRHGAAAALAVAALSAGIAAGLGAAAAGSSGAISGALLALPIVALPAAAASAVVRGLRPPAGFLVLAGAGLLVIAVGALAWPQGREQVTREMRSSFDRSITPGALAKYRAADMRPEEIEQAHRILEMLRDFFTKCWPGLLGAFWVFGSAGAFYAGAALARPAPSAMAVRFERLRVPAAFALAFVLAGAGAALSSGPLRIAAGNVLPPLVALYFLTGLSIICAFARRWFRVAALRTGLYLLAAYPPMCIVVTLLGLFDWYADFRRFLEGASKKP